MLDASLSDCDVSVARSPAGRRSVAAHSLASRRTKIIFFPILGLSVACVFLQAVIQPSSENVFCSIMAAGSAIIACAYLFPAGALLNYPLSAVAILGLTASSCFIPLWGQSITLRPLDYNLNSPLTTFALGSGLTLLAVICHMLYTQLSLFKPILAMIRRGVVKPLGLFKSPSTIQVYGIGLIGVLCTIYSSGFGAESVVVTGDVFGKAAQAIRPLAVAPIAALFSDLYRGQRIRWTGIAIYFVVLLGLAAVANARSIVGSAVLLGLLAFLLRYLSGRWRFSKANAIALVVFVLIGALLVPVIGRLSAAIVVTRSERANLSQGQLLVQTIENLFDPELQAPSATARPGNYNEEYSRSEFLNRVSLVKFTDNVISEASSLSDGQKEQIRDDAWRRVLALAPQPILNLFDLDAGKEEKPFSSGDLYAVLSGSYPFLGSFLTGSSIADATVVLGWLAPLVYGFIIVLSFILKDSLAGQGTRSGSLPLISLCGLVVLPQTFLSGLTSDSLAGLIGLLVRGYLQTIIVTALLFLVVGVPFTSRDRLLE